MKLEIDINEAKILELANVSSAEDLPKSIFYEAKRQAVEIAVKEIKDKLVEKSYYSNTERLYSEVSEALYKQIDARIKELISERFSEKNLELIITCHADKVITEWLEKKIYSRLEELKKDIFIGSCGELEAEQKAMEDAHKREIEQMEV